MQYPTKNIDNPNSWLVPVGEMAFWVQENTKNGWVMPTLNLGKVLEHAARDGRPTYLFHLQWIIKSKVIDQQKGTCTWRLEPLDHTSGRNAQRCPTAPLIHDQIKLDLEGTVHARTGTSLETFLAYPGREFEGSKPLVKKQGDYAGLVRKRRERKSEVFELFKELQLQIKSTDKRVLAISLLKKKYPYSVATELKKNGVLITDYQLDFLDSKRAEKLMDKYKKLKPAVLNAVGNEPKSSEQIHKDLKRNNSKISRADVSLVLSLLEQDKKIARLREQTSRKPMTWCISAQFAEAT